MLQIRLICNFVNCQLVPTAFVMNPILILTFSYCFVPHILCIDKEMTEILHFEMLNNADKVR